MARARILYLGDAVRLAVLPRLERLLSEDSLEIVGPPGSCGAGAAFAEGVAGWVESYAPDMACFGFGPWAMEDVQRVVASGDGVGMFEPVALADFERGLLSSASALQRWCGRQVVYSTTPPVHEGRVGQASGDPDFGHRLNSWIAMYNQQAMGLLGELNIGAADIHYEIARHDEDALEEDGVALSPVGVELAARELAKGIYGVVHP